MKKWRLIIDVAKCENCNNCFLACKDEHCGNHWPGYAASQPLHGHRWMNILRKERGRFPVMDAAYLPMPCQHCENPPCVRSAKSGAITKRPDGIVLIDPVKAKGDRDMPATCPYGAIWWNAETQTPQKCTLCAHLLDSGWKAPRCVQACPTGALSIIKATDEEFSAIAAAQGLEPLVKGGRSTTPGVRYRNLHRFTRCFIAGSAATTPDGVAECAAGVAVALIQDGQTLQETVTDTFGDFKFDGLAENSGVYEVRLTSREKKTVTVSAALGRSVSAGTIWL